MCVCVHLLVHLRECLFVFSGAPVLVCVCMCVSIRILCSPLMPTVYCILYVQYGDTPLHDASYNGKLECVKYLCSVGASVDAKDDVSSIIL